MKKKKAPTNILKARYESFGGIIALEEPPVLAWVDKNFMLELGFKGSPLWQREKNYLSAPTEVHFSLTNKCPLKCKHCYANSGNKIRNELTTNQYKKALRVLAKMGVFHIAFGGGECFSRSDVFELAHYCRELGMVPNITTNGYYITKETAKKCRVFGRINVSLDGIGKMYKEIRGVDGFKMADRAIKLLVEEGNRVGINCILCRKNFDTISEIVKYAKRQKLESILFLRYKPVGRGKIFYKEMRLTNEQNKKIFPLIKKLQKENKEILFEIDCSFVPMICFHKPSLEKLKFFAVEGCPAGNILLGTLPNGRFNACSMCSETGGSIFSLPREWNTSKHLNKFRQWILKAKEPCRSCSYLEICKGGCHIITEYLTGNFFNPDPECPKVVEFKAKNKTKN